jgi:hypothetical protein
VNFYAIVASDNHDLHAGQGVLTRNELAGVFGGIAEYARRVERAGDLHGYVRLDRLDFAGRQFLPLAELFRASLENAVTTLHLLIINDLILGLPRKNGHRSCVIH